MILGQGIFFHYCKKRGVKDALSDRFWEQNFWKPVICSQLRISLTAKTSLICSTTGMAKSPSRTYIFQSCSGLPILSGWLLDLHSHPRFEMIACLAFILLSFVENMCYDWCCDAAKVNDLIWCFIVPGYMDCMTQWTLWIAFRFAVTSDLCRQNMVARGVGQKKFLIVCRCRNVNFREVEHVGPMFRERTRKPTSWSLMKS